MGRIRRPTKRVAAEQRGFGFEGAWAETPARPAAVADIEFKEDDPSKIFIGDERADAHLTRSDMGWVIKLREILVKLDYSSLTVKYSNQGRHAFHPRTMLGLILYGLFVRQKSLRDLERLSAVDLGAMWICGGHRIDHTTICRFLRLHADSLSAEFFAAVTRHVVKQIKLRPGTASIDGTVVESAASHWQLLSAEAAEIAARQARQESETQPHDAALKAVAEHAARVSETANGRCAQRKAQGKPTQSVRVAASDPQAVVQPRKDGAHRPGYRPSTLMHEGGVIIGQFVHPSSETAAVMPLIDQHMAIFGVVPTTLLMDAGFHNGSVLGDLCERDIDVLCPSGQAMGRDDWQKKGRNGRFSKSDFRYDESRDVYQCPAGEDLAFSDQRKDRLGREFRRYRAKGCGQCQIKAQCTAARGNRTIQRYNGEHYKEAMALVLENPRARSAYQRRMVIAEPVHAELRERLGLRRFHRRGLVGVRVEFALYCIAFNLKKALRGPILLVIFIVLRPVGAPRHRLPLISLIASVYVAGGA